MPTDCISYQTSGYFSPLMNDYLDENSNLQSLYSRFPKLENFVVGEMTDMIMATRMFESTQQAIKAFDSMNSKLVNEVGKIR